MKAAIDIVWSWAPIVLMVVAVWWASTGAILLLGRLPERTYGTSLAVAAGVAVVGLFAIVGVRDGTERSDVLIAWLGALAIWAAIEMSFLMGLVVGPRRFAMAQQQTGWARFTAAASAISYHEALLLAALAGIAWLTFGAANTAAAATFGLLWALRLSTKFNIFFGVPNPGEEMLPRRIKPLATHFRRAPMTAFFPLSVTAATIIAVLFGAQAYAAAAGSGAAMSAMLLATLAGLGVIEHWFLVLPMRADALWTLHLRSRDPVTGSSSSAAQKSQTFARGVAQ